jgi:myosin heavy subunit
VLIGGVRGRSNASTLSSKSLSWRLTNQLSALIAMLKRTNSHFIRCIKSNDECAPARFASGVVYKQLVCSGVFEVVKIQQSGLPCRLSHEEYLQRYRCLVTSSKLRFELYKPIELIQCLTRQGYDLSLTCIGVNATFYKPHEQRMLESRRDSLLKVSSLCISRFMQMKTRHYLYSHLLRYHRDFGAYDMQFDLLCAADAYDKLVSYCHRMHRVVRYDVLAHVIISLQSRLNRLEKRVALLSNAIDQLKIRTKESILDLEKIVSSAIDLEMTSHHVMVECRNRVQKYYRAIEFVSVVKNSIGEGKLIRYGSSLELLSSLCVARRSYIQALSISCS